MCVYFSPLNEGGELGQLLTKAKISQNTELSYKLKTDYWVKSAQIVTSMVIVGTLLLIINKVCQESYIQ